METQRKVYITGPVVQIKHDGKWEYFSEQVVFEGEARRSDAEYLAACQALEPGALMRIKYSNALRDRVTQ